MCCPCYGRTASLQSQTRLLNLYLTFVKCRQRESTLKGLKKSKADAKEATRMVQHCRWRGKQKQYQHDSPTCWWKNKAKQNWLGAGTSTSVALEPGSSRWKRPIMGPFWMWPPTFFVEAPLFSKCHLQVLYTVMIVKYIQQICDILHLVSWIETSEEAPTLILVHTAVCSHCALKTQNNNIRMQPFFFFKK